MARTLFPVLVLALARGAVGAKKPFTCDEYEDDTVYSATTCGSYDDDTCQAQCWSNSTCDVLCGSGNVSCADGGGAVCAMKRLAHIDATCASLASMKAKDGIPSRLEPSSDRRRERERRLRATDAESAAAHPVISNEGQGCDDHVYCTYCVGFAECEYLIEHSDDFITTTSTSFGPIALELLRNMDHICANRSASLGDYETADDLGIDGGNGPSGGGTFGTDDGGTTLSGGLGGGLGGGGALATPAARRAALPSTDALLAAAGGDGAAAATSDGRGRTAAAALALAAVGAAGAFAARRVARRRGAYRAVGEGEA